jgi:hypothetical protein
MDTKEVILPVSTPSLESGQATQYLCFGHGINPEAPTASFSFEKTLPHFRNRFLILVTLWLFME